MVSYLIVSTTLGRLIFAKKSQYIQFFLIPCIFASQDGLAWKFIAVQCGILMHFVGPNWYRLHSSAYLNAIILAQMFQECCLVESLFFLLRLLDILGMIFLPKLYIISTQLHYGKIITKVSRFGTNYIITRLSRLSTHLSMGLG